MSQVSLDNRRLLMRLAIAAVVMFGFGFALVPFYKLFCEVTGINNLLQRDEVGNTQVDSAREVMVQFDTNTRNLPWRFKPLQNGIKTHPGALTRVDFEIENTTDRAITGQAIPSYGPQQAAQYFKKLECFCFSAQTLSPREKRVMPVVFVVSPDIPEELSTVTLSYTFFDLPANAARVDVTKVGG